ncbi:MAG: putative O-methyltransferase YrrM [Halieaceae bacterium]|jgi:predicted O-methyltransferase YrrM
MTSDSTGPAATPSLTEQADALYQQALNELEAQAYSDAAISSQRAVQLDPANGQYISALAQSLMPGKGYKYLLKRIHQEYQPKGYLEIGVSKGKSMALANAETHVVGIDPAFQIDAEISAQARLFPIPSDDFFARYNLFDELRYEQLDIVFIDGLHLFEQVLKDFVNVERYANKNTVVLIHDCFPVSELTAERNRSTNFWTGDVWKIIPCLHRERPDLNVNVIPCRPSGLGIITGLNPQSTHLASNLDSLMAHYAALGYQDIPEDRDHYFATVGNNWDAISQLWPTQ